MDDTLNMITGLTAAERSKALSWWVGRSEELRVGIMQDAVKQYYLIKDSHPELEGRLGRYCGLLRAVRHGGWDTIKGKGFRVASQEQFTDFTNLRQAKAATLIKRGRTPVLRKKILAYWGEIVEMKAQGLGFRPITEYLLKERKIKTSSVYLGRLWLEVQNG